MAYDQGAVTWTKLTHSYLQGWIWGGERGNLGVLPPPQIKKKSIEIAIVTIAVICIDGGTGGRGSLGPPPTFLAGGACPPPFFCRK